ncbi:MAG: DNA-processing protein DprA [Bacillota bacterium]
MDINKFIFNLEKTKGIGYKTTHKILLNAKNIDEFRNNKEKIINIKNMSLSKYKKVLQKYKTKKFKKYMEVLQKMDINLINKFNKNFPDKLKEIPKAPYCLHLRGDIDILKNKTVGIIGSRDYTQYGKKAAFKLSKMLSKKGYTVISGLAKGIDSFSHKGALKGKGKTVSVIGSGIDVIYPKENTKLYLDIVNEGLVVSEFFLGIQPRKYNFPRRNRIISGLSDFLIVIQAGESSGTMITVNHALKQNKEIFAVPGEIFCKKSIGTNRLIRDGATPIVSLEEFSKFLENY